MTTEPTVTPTESAVAVGRSLGLRVERPVVLRDSLSLLVHLAPAPVLARVDLRPPLVRPTETLTDSLALAAYLAGEGLPVAPPVDEVDPGPHVGPGGWRLTLWRFFETINVAPDPRDVGRSLRAIHEAAAAYEGPMRQVGPLAEIRRLADAAESERPREVALLRRHADALQLPELPVQPLHGDAHLGNVLATTSGLRWVDWEESWRGPIAWDLACFEHRRRVFGELEEEIGTALSGYGAYDADAVAAYGWLITVYAAALGLVLSAGGLDLGEEARRRLAWLEAQRPRG